MNPIDSKLREWAAKGLISPDALPPKPVASGPGDYFAPGVRLTLPWPPALNGYYRHVGPKVLISEKGRQYRRTVVGLCSGGRTLTGQLDVAIQAYPPDRRRRDVDGMLKAVLDALTHAGVYADDSQIDVLSIRRLGVEAPGRLEIHINGA